MSSRTSASVNSGNQVCSGEHCPCCFRWHCHSWSHCQAPPGFRSSTSGAMWWGCRVPCLPWTFPPLWSLLSFLCCHGCCAHIHHFCCKCPDSYAFAVLLKLRAAAHCPRDFRTLYPSVEASSSKSLLWAFHSMFFPAQSLSCSLLYFRVGDRSWRKFILISPPEEKTLCYSLLHYPLSFGAKLLDMVGVAMLKVADWTLCLLESLWALKIR